MKQHKWLSVVAFCMALCLMLAWFPVQVEATEAESGKKSIDFVLIMDCSGTMLKNDPDKLAAEACKMFVDLIPVEDARVSIVTFGYEDENPFAFTQFEVTFDTGMIHSISQMEGKLGTEAKNEIKAAIAAASSKNGPRSPIGAALAAGMEVLLGSNAADDSACLILMSDGDVSSGNLAQSDQLLSTIPSMAKERGWPIYCIELDYEGWNESGISSGDYNGKKARQLLNQIVVESGAGEEGRMKVNDAAQVSEAFMKIFADLWGGDTDVTTETLDESGVVIKQFKIPQLVSEATIAVSGDSVDRVHLTGPNFDKELQTTLTEKNLIVSREESYMCIKLICPASGDWTVSVYGDPNAEIILYKGLQMEMNLDMAAVATSEALELTKNDYINIQARYTYNDNIITGDEIYQTTLDAAKLIVSNSNGMITEFPVEATLDGYTCKLPVVDVPSGDFTVRLEVEHSMFRSGKASSNESTLFHSENLPLTYQEGVNTDRSGYVNNSLDRIELDQVFLNPDGDPVSYTLTCTSEKNASFDYTLDPETGYLTIEAGMTPGTYQMEVTAADPDMVEPLKHSFTLTVRNRAVSEQEIPEQTIWTDYFNLLWIRQDPANTQLDLNLNDYFTDPDGVELVYDNATVSGEGSAQAQIDGSVLHVDSATKGDMEISFTVSDGVDTLERQVSLKAVSGRSVYLMRYGWIYLVILAVIVVTAIAVWLILKNKRVKGTWDISFESYQFENLVDPLEDVDIPSRTREGKKSKFYFRDLVTELCQEYDGNTEQVVSSFFVGTGAEKIQLGGVYGRRGCVVLKVPREKDIPQDTEVEVRRDGLTITKKTTVKSGSLCFTIRRNDREEEMTITMRMR